jgi:hypothetical protein
MKKYHIFRFSSIFAMFSILLLAATACEDVIERTESPAYNTNSSNVYFASTNSSSIVIGLTDETFDVVVKREKTTAAQEVNLKLESSLGDMFTVPDKVTFAVGEAEKAITVTVGDIELMKSYHFAIEIDQDQTKPYVAQNVYPRIELNVLREDYAPYAEGTYYDLFFAPGDDYVSWPQVLEYSEMTDTYRMKDVWVEGYDVKFKWTGGATLTMVGTVSGSYTYIPSGYVHPTYGMIYAYYGNCTYTSGTKEFYFPITWRVSAGSFGMYPDYYVITRLL